MKLDTQELFDLLTEKNIHYLHHANTVATAITYIEAGGLLSRGYVENAGLFQTKQASDPIDKKFDVFEDIFLDSTDLHTYFNRQNHYGPILFKFSIDFLREENFDVWVTKDNPINWNSNMSDGDKYFESVAELMEKWDKYQRQRKMITIRKVAMPILFNYIDCVILDDPRVQIPSSGIVYFNEAVEGLKQAYNGRGELKNKFKTRECSNCFCRSNYLNELPVAKLNRIFLPHKE